MNRLLLIAFLLALVSCKKEKASEDALIGKWKLTGIYHGYVMGGCFCWYDVADANADVLEFFITGRYELKKSLLSSSTGCSGRYRVLTDTTIALTYECQANPSDEIIRKYNKTINELIIDYQSIEGVVRYRYKRN
jgi:hypothetical protein